MSLQVCHCGWSKVTTYHGLRTHQGMKGCMLKGARVAESEQQYMLANVANLGLTNKDLKLDVCTSIKNDTTDFYSKINIRVCHCGWAKVTTYQGLGRMGCTAKGMKTPLREQYDGKNEQEEDQKKHQPTNRATVKNKEVKELAGSVLALNSLGGGGQQQDRVAVGVTRGDINPKGKTLALVSFYNVTAQSHIYSLTECSFTGEIFPYCSVHPTQDYETPLTTLL